MRSKFTTDSEFTTRTVFSMSGPLGNGTRFLTWRKTQVSAIFPRTFPGIETASFWDLSPACQGPGGGVGNCRGLLDNQRSSLDDWEYLSCLFGDAGSFSLTCSIPNPKHFTTNMLMQSTIMIMQSEDGIPICTRCNLQLVTKWP